MAEEFYTPSQNALKRTAKAVRMVLGDERQRPVARRGRRPPRGGDGCDPQNEKHQFFILGSPTAGSFTATYIINSVSEEMEFDFDFTSAEFKTELATHSEVLAADLTVTGGDFPDASITVEFGGNLAGTEVPVPNVDWTDLTGGVGVIVARVQKGLS